ncbi:MAG: TRAP transporter small permease [Aurantimonas endophytica]|uniref:TRAP transporter small permease protein n=1 Tax=Aurantimonas endophytica TaxID=1522175 RepID=A0A7W6HG26_9HYPH|nr:TRAP transporter small permease [Aurantimonas endophytica]MBB4004493.1 TRAP-type C4-dicarboxylate transport system permease small subunit [Aurantimonas endophytica]
MASDHQRPEPEAGIRAEEPSALASEPVDLSDIRWSDGLVLLVFWLLSFVVFLQFFTRYVLNNSLGWTEEVARFLLIGVTFIGSVMAARKESHIAVELFYRYLPRRGRYVAQLAVDVISLVFFAAMGWFCAELASKTQQMMVSIDVPKSWIYWGVTACFGFMAMYALLALLRHVRTGTSRLIDPERFALTGTGL